MKKYLNDICSIFIIIQPILDVLTGIGIHYFHMSITIGIIIRFLFLLGICILPIIYKKYKILILYGIIALYMIFYSIGMKEMLFQNIQELFHVFYFPIILVTLYSFRKELKGNSLILFLTLCIYLLFLFIPTIFQVGYKTYEITKQGKLGFFNSANEISGILSILTPFLFLYIEQIKKIGLKLLIIIIYFFTIVTIGTKTPIISLGLTLLITSIYISKRSIQKKNWKPMIYLGIGVVLGIIGLIIIIPKTNFYKNIETHRKFLKIDEVSDITDEKILDHFIFSQRLSFLKEKQKQYNKSSTYKKLFGIGYYQGIERTKSIEMDYFDIYYSHGIIGFIIVCSIFFSLLIFFLKTDQEKSYQRLMRHTAIFLAIILSFFTGHIITSPSVAILVIYLLISCYKEKKRILFVCKEEKGLDNFKKNNKEKYNITILKDKNYSYIKRIIEYHTYDFSCSYKIDNKLVISASKYNSIYDCDTINPYTFQISKKKEKEKIFLPKFTNMNQIEKYIEGDSVER